MFTLASDTKTKDASGKYVTIFYRVTTWRRLAENVAQYLHKGDHVTVHGDLSLRSYADRNGVNRTSVQISADHVEFPSRRSNTAVDESSAPTVYPAPAAAPESMSDDELPF